MTSTGRCARACAQENRPWSFISSGLTTIIAPTGAPGPSEFIGLLVGITVSFTSFYFPEMATLSMFLLMALVLIFRPRGLFGRAGLME